MIESTVDLQAAENHEFVINPDFDPKLKSLRLEIGKLQSRVKSEAISVSKPIMRITHD